MALMESEKIASSDLFQSPVPGGWRTKRFDCHSLQEEAHFPIGLSFSPCGMGSVTTLEGAEMSLSVCGDMDVSGLTATAMSSSWLRTARWRSGKGKAAVGLLCRDRHKEDSGSPFKSS